MGCFATERGKKEEIICVRKKRQTGFPFPFLSQFSLQHFRFLTNPPSSGFSTFSVSSRLLYWNYSLSLISLFLIAAAAAAAVQFSFPSRRKCHVLTIPRCRYLYLFDSLSLSVLANPSILLDLIYNICLILASISSILTIAILITIYFILFVVMGKGSRYKLVCLLFVAHGWW